MKRVLASAAIVTVALTIAGCSVSATDPSAAQGPGNGAQHTAARSDSNATTSQANALRAAQDYLSFQAFSKAGLIDQLSSRYGDGYSKADAEWAVNQLSVDWNEQAYKAGQDYLNTQPFSRNGLIQQLSSPYGDKFTKEQAIYAVDKLGL